MAFIDWDDRMSVGIEEIDKQHKRLLALINDLHGACHEDCPSDKVDNAADALTEYTRVHFATEEQYMDGHSYPGQEEHMEEHMEFSLKAMDFFGDYVSGSNPGLNKEMLAYLKDWLLNHILKTDRRLGAFLRKEGMS